MERRTTYVALEEVNSTDTKNVYSLSELSVPYEGGAKRAHACTDYERNAPIAAGG